MGYSTSLEQENRLRRNRDAGRQCAVATGRGGCFNRATYRCVEDLWTYEREMLAELPPHEHVATYCRVHVLPPGYVGTNFKVRSTERF